MEKTERKRRCAQCLFITSLPLLSVKAATNALISISYDKVADAVGNESACLLLDTECANLRTNGCQVTLLGKLFIHYASVHSAVHR